MDMPAPSTQVRPMMWLQSASIVEAKIFHAVFTFLTPGYVITESREDYIVRNALNTQEATERVWETLRSSRAVESITVLAELGPVDFDYVLDIHYHDGSTIRFGMEVTELEFDENGVADL